MSLFLAPLRPAEVFRECLFIGVDQKWPDNGQNGANDPLPTSMTELTVDGRNSRLGPGLIRPTAPYRTRSGARLHCSRENGLTHFDALQVLRAAFSARTKSLTSRGWQILSGSSCSVWSCSAAGIVEPLHHRPTAVGKSAAHLACTPAALVACPCDPVQTIAKSRSAK